MDKKYGIQIIGYGKNQRYCIKEILKNGLIIPVNYKTYSNKQKAIEAAEALNIKILCTGDIYELLSIA